MVIDVSGVRACMSMCVCTHTHTFLFSKRCCRMS